MWWWGALLWVAMGGGLCPVDPGWEVVTVLEFFVSLDVGFTEGSDVGGSLDSDLAVVCVALVGFVVFGDGDPADAFGFSVVEFALLAEDAGGDHRGGEGAHDLAGFFVAHIVLSIPVSCLGSLATLVTVSVPC